MDESESVLSAEDESEEPESLLSAVDEAESAESLVLESTVSESEESEDLVSEESEEEESELSEDCSAVGGVRGGGVGAVRVSLSEESELSEELESEDLESEELASELSELLSDALTEAGSAADACVGAAMTMTMSTSPHRAAARTAILRALASGRAHSVVPMPVTSRPTSSKRATVSLTVLQFQPRGVSR